MTVVSDCDVLESVPRRRECSSFVSSDRIKPSESLILICYLIGCLDTRLDPTRDGIRGQLRFQRMIPDGNEDILIPCTKWFSTL